MSGLTWRRISCHTTLTTIHPAVVRTYLHTLEGQVKRTLEFPQKTRSMRCWHPQPKYPLILAPRTRFEGFLKTLNLFLLLCSFPWPNGPCGWPRYCKKYRVGLGLEPVSGWSSYTNTESRAHSKFSYQSLLEDLLNFNLKIKVLTTVVIATQMFSIRTLLSLLVADCM